MAPFPVPSEQLEYRTEAISQFLFEILGGVTLIDRLEDHVIPVVDALAGGR
ncbi:hypothetical protein [Roseobacter litoralis]|uniref:hypothetical protein n=1 Tax=Roseobacter litoralis TaxID=42443 RepID=UPI00249300AA|nr:hypothetical protein [Roseobacter litoralis]